MNYLKFKLCLTWPMCEDEKQEEGDFKSLAYLTNELELILACGLDADIYELSAWMLPRTRSGDYDGDGTIDEVAQIIRKSDGKRGLAICRAGASLDIIGISGGMGKHLAATYFDHIDWWETYPRGSVS